MEQTTGFNFCVKKTLRREALRKRGLLTDAEKRTAGDRVFGLLVSSPEYQAAQQLLIYVSYRDELSTDALIIRALQDGKEVFCPRVVPSANLMYFSKIQSLSDMMTGYRGIREPGDHCNELWKAGEGGEYKRTLIIIPGSAFDRNGNRLGYGSGYYDHFLSAQPSDSRIRTVGLCYSCQIFDQVPSERNDVPVDILISDEGLLRLYQEP